MTICRTIFILLLLFTATIIYANDDEILDRKVRISLSKATKYEYFRSISDETGYQFVYDSSVISNDKEIAIPPGEYVLRELIPIIAENLPIDIKILGNHIILSAASNKRIQPLPPVKQAPPPYTVVTGRIFDLFSKETIPSATLMVTDAGIGTITNQDGFFRLAIADSLRSNTIRISHIGYENREFTLSDVTDGRIDLPLEPKVIALQEVVIRVIDPIQTTQKMLDERKRNYAANPAALTVFYREGVEHKKKNVDLTEAVLQIYKPGFADKLSNDQVKLVKKRRVIDRQEKDTILTKVKAGIHSALLLDIVRHIPDFLEASPANEFTYTHTDISVVDNRLVYVIDFEQKKHIKEPLYKGQLYIDTENYALLEARIEINPKHVEQATPLYVEKRSRNHRLTLRKAAYTLSYRPALDGTHYLNHVRGDLEFRVKRKSHLFSSTMNVWFQMVNCHTDKENVQPIPRQERFSPRSILSETNYSYDPDFWGDMNVIVPEEELKEFILRNLGR